MSTHGRSGIERWVHGSVAERVLRRSPAPLLLANPFTFAKRPEQAPPFQRIVVPLDGSENAAMALPRAATLARFFSAEVVLLHVVPEALADGELVGAVHERELEGLELLEAARGALSPLVVRTRLERGVPANVILDVVADEHADLLAMTTRGRSGATRWTFGSVAEDVLRHARCPVLVERFVERELETERRVA
jgi:nucleotide-binding universal stress UspA family protein